MNRFRLSKAGIDYREGLSRFLGDRSTYERMLAMFPDDESYNEMIDAYDAGNVEDAFSCAHTLKGVAGNLSMTRLYADMSPMVEELRSGNLEGGRMLLPPVRESYLLVLGTVNDELKRASERS